MPSKQELQRLNLSVLAGKCKKVSDDSSAVGKTALQLHNEWRLLIHSQMPPQMPPKAQQANKAKEKKLKDRMAEFLAGTL